MHFTLTLSSKDTVTVEVSETPRQKYLYVFTGPVSFSGTHKYWRKKENVDNLYEDVLAVAEILNKDLRRFAKNGRINISHLLTTKPKANRHGTSTKTLTTIIATRGIRQNKRSTKGK